MPAAVFRTATHVQVIKMAQSLGKRGICQEAAFAQGHTVAGCKSQIARIQPPRKRQALLRNKLPQLLATGVALESPGSFAREPTEEVLQVWRQADAVCFDVDSTLCEDESIDELAAHLGHGEAVAALTTKAMGGVLKFEDTLAMRLDLMQPSKTAIADFLKAHPPRLSKGEPIGPQLNAGIPELVGRLQSEAKAVFLVSGGFRVIINPIAQQLNIPLDHVFANTILHKEDGSYAGFDTKELTSRSGGKLAAIKRIKMQYGYQTMVMVGDGATDLEARQNSGADIFIGYGGTVVRPAIAAQADWYVNSMQPLIEALG